MSSPLILWAYFMLFSQPCIAAIGIVFNCVGLYEAGIDLQLTTMHNGHRRLVAQAHYEWEVIRLCVQVLFFIIGALTLLYPPDPTIIYARSTIVIINRSCLVLATFLLTFKSILGLRYQQQLLRIWLTERRNGKVDHD